MQTQSWVATIFFALIAFGGGYFAGTHAPAGASGTPAYGVAAGREDACYFSPSGGCTQAIVNEIDLAKHSLELLGYSFTSRPIGSALVAAHKRGVDVKLVLDAGQTSEYRHEAQYVANSGIPVFLDARHGIAHNKVILIDDRTVITGSFNFTRAAEEENAENVLILRDRLKLQAVYEEDFRKHLSHSQRYDGQ
jgi:phosphatidylserine/phosphatidylglycerophosphate/cardiolipin synthase-like enzyme